VRSLNWNGYRWFAGGSSSTPTFGAYSYDGITWTTLNTTQTAGATQINGIAFNSTRSNSITFPSNITVAVGQYNATNTNGNIYAPQSTTAFSRDNGLTWTAGTNVFGITASFSATFSGTTMTVISGSVFGTIHIGQIFTGLGIVGSGGSTSSTTNVGLGYVSIVANLTATTWTISVSQSVISTPITIVAFPPPRALVTYTTTISSSSISLSFVGSGIITVGTYLAFIPTPSWITSLGTGTGGTGTYNLNNVQSATQSQGGNYTDPACSFSATIGLTTMSVAAITYGRIYIGQLISGSGVTANSFVTAFGTGSGQTGTYILTQSSTVTSVTAMTATYSTPFATGYCVATNGIIWLTGGTNNLSGDATITLGYSYDGISWMYVEKSYNIFSTNVRGIAWSPVLKIWVAVGSGTNQLAYSYDGFNWIGVSNVTFGTSLQGYCVVWANDKFVACGGNTGTTTTGNKLYYSYDGKTWTAAAATTTPLAVGVYGIGYNGTMYVCVGNNNGASSVAYSYDGITWTTTPTGSVLASTSNISGSVSWDSNKWVICGSYSNLSAINFIYYSYDGINWIASTSLNSAAGNGIVWNGNKFVITTTIPTSSGTQIYTSNDGITWTVNSSNTFGNNAQALAWSINQPNSGQQLTNVAIQQPTLALGAGTNSIAYSYDGISWRGLGKTIFTTSGQGACWNGKIWVAGGISGSGVLAYSYNGINWTIATQSIFTTAVYSIAWNGTVFVAAGQGTTTVLAYSYNGINWTSSATRASVAMSLARNVTWGQNYFVAVGFSGTFSVTAGFATAGTLLTVTSISGGTLAVGQLLTGGTPTALTAGTYITGPTGSATFTGSFVLAGTLLTVSAVSGTITVGQLLSGGTVTAGTSITGPTGSATFTGGAITGTAFTLTSVSSGTIAIGQLLSGGTVLANTYIISGSGLSWTVNNSQTSTGITTSTSSPTGLYWTVNNSQIAGATATSSTSSLTTFPQYWTVNNSQPITGGPFTSTYGYYNAATFTGTIATTTLTVSAVTGTISIGQLVYGGTVSANTYITAGSGLSWTVSVSQTSTATGSAGGGAAYSLDGINWTGITSASVYNSGSGYNSVIFADNRWLIYASNGNSATYVLYASSLTATNPWTYYSLQTGQSTSYGITYGLYPITLASGTTYGTVLIIGYTSSTVGGYYYSIDGGTSWVAQTASLTTPYSQCCAWNGNRFVFGLFTSTGSVFDMRYITNPVGVTWPTSLTSIVNPTGPQLFTSVNSFGVSAWPTLGSIYVDNALTTSGTSGLNTNNQLDIYSDTYFNNGYNNMALTVKSTKIP
jgi:hypothetical protein